MRGVLLIVALLTLVVFAVVTNAMAAPSGPSFAANVTSNNGPPPNMTVARAVSSEGGAAPFLAHSRRLIDGSERARIYALGFQRVVLLPDGIGGAAPAMAHSKRPEVLALVIDTNRVQGHATGGLTPLPACSKRPVAAFTVAGIGHQHDVGPNTRVTNSGQMARLLMTGPPVYRTGAGMIGIQNIHNCMFSKINEHGYTAARPAHQATNSERALGSEMNEMDMRTTSPSPTVGTGLAEYKQAPPASWHHPLLC